MAFTRSPLMVFFLMGTVVIALPHKISRRFPLMGTYSELSVFAPRSSRVAKTNEELQVAQTFPRKEQQPGKSVVAEEKMKPAATSQYIGRSNNARSPPDSDCVGFDDNNRCVDTISNFRKFRTKLKDVTAAPSKYEEVKDTSFSSLMKMKRAQHFDRTVDKVAKASNLESMSDAVSSGRVNVLGEPSKNVEMEEAEPSAFEEEMERDGDRSPSHVVEVDVAPSHLVEMDISAPSRRVKESVMGAADAEMVAASVGGDGSSVNRVGGFEVIGIPTNPPGGSGRDGSRGGGNFAKAC